jgi:hypothetical protein
MILVRAIPYLNIVSVKVSLVNRLGSVPSRASLIQSAPDSEEANQWRIGKLSIYWERYCDG